MSTQALFEPLAVGDMELKQRIAMAPLTRFRADVTHVHSEIGELYYRQRGSAPGTLLITEATFIAPQAGGYAHVPGIYNEAQIQAWKQIVDAVHSNGSFIFLQLWALGRAAKPAVLAAEPEGPFDVVSASDVPLNGGVTPRPLTEVEISDYVHWYAQAAKNFVEKAGGDGVEIHGANGYLIDQFLQTNTNNRTDSYGGTVENRARFALQVVDAVAKAVGPKKTGIRLSPYSVFQGMKMSQNEIKETFSFVVSQLKAKHPYLAYIHVIEGHVPGAQEGESIDFLYDIWAPGVFLAASGLNRDLATEIVSRRPNSVAVFGKDFIANPDLVHKLRHNIRLTPYNESTFYRPLGPDGVEGYTDYPISD